MPARFAFGQHPPASHTIVHLSDPHFLAGDALLAGHIDVAARFERMLEAVARLEVRPDAIVVTGDLTDLGEPEAYRRLRAVLGLFAQELGTPLVWVAGNHDERPALRAELLDLEPSEEPVMGVWDLNGLRLVALDTSVPGWHHGELGEYQLGRLADILREPAPHGTLLAMHHPPLPSHIPLFGILELEDQRALADVVAGTDVRGILAGHLHYSSYGSFAGIPVSVASAGCYTMNLARPALEVNGMDAAQSFQLVHVYPTTITHTTVPVADAETASFFTRSWAERMAAMTPDERREAFSRKPLRE